MKSAYVTMAWSAGASAVTGLATWYFVRRYYEEVLASEIDSLKTYYDRKADRRFPTNPSLEEVTARYTKLAEQYDTADETEPEDVVIQANEVTVKVGAEHEDWEDMNLDDPADQFPSDLSAEQKRYNDEGFAAQVKARNLGLPYIISLEEFLDAEDYEAMSLEWYHEDRLVVDSNSDEVVMDHPKTIGRETLEYFGWLSDDPNVVYAKNDQRKEVYEITFNPGHHEASLIYTEKSRDRRENRPGKMRAGDE